MKCGVKNADITKDYLLLLVVTATLPLLVLTLILMPSLSCYGKINGRCAAAFCFVCERESGDFGELDCDVARGSFDVNIIYDNIGDGYI